MRLDCDNLISGLPLLDPKCKVVIVYRSSRTNHLPHSRVACPDFVRLAARVNSIGNGIPCVIEV